MLSAYIIGLCGLASAVTSWVVHNTAIARAVQSLYRPFSGRGKLHHVLGVRPSCTVWAATRAARFARGGHSEAQKIRRFFAGNLKDFLLEIFSRIFRRS